MSTFAGWAVFALLLLIAAGIAIVVCAVITKGAI